LPSKSEEYSREFIKNFGVFDQAHDWNHATRTSVTVTTSTPTDIKVCANFNGKLYSFGEYKNVDGKQTLNVDVPKGTTDLIVRANGQNKAVKAGGEVVLGSRSRITLDSSSEGATGVTAELCTDESQWMVVPLLNATMFRSKMPEGCYNADRDGVSVDFSFKFKEHDIIVRPLYWQTNQTSSFGFFYLDSDGKPVHIPIYDMERTDGTYSDDLVLCYAPTEVRTVKIEDYANNKDFVECLNAYGVNVIERKNDWDANPVKILDVNKSDNFLYPTAIDDRKVTFACRKYLEDVRGLKNDRDADENSRYNYVYRWQTTGTWVYANPTPIHPIPQAWHKDMEITYTIFNYDMEKAKGFGNDIDMIKGLYEFAEVGYPALISKGIKVHFDNIDRTYGAYIKRSDGRYLYSVSSLNEKNRWIPKPGAERTERTQDWQVKDNYVMKYKPSDFMIEEGKKAYRAATWVGEKYSWRYMSFEDGVIGDTYNAGECDFDMQDFVFIIDGVDPDYDDPVDEIVEEDPTPEPETWEWIIACEDLGTNDFDFNDVVFSVSGVEADVKTDTKTVTVKALASGGTLPVYIYYDGKMIVPDGADNGEFHSWFGDGSYSTTTVINASGLRADGRTATVTVPADFTMECCLKVTEGESGNMGGFKVEVKHLDGSSIIEATNPNIDSEIGTAPQMICVPGTWLWPTENTHIRTVYEKFVDWCAKGHDATLNWHEHRAPSGYWKR